MKFLDFENIEYAFSGMRHGAMNFVGHEYFDGERRANRNAFLKESLNLSPLETVVPKLYHTGRCEVVSLHNPIYGSVNGDAILTDKKGLALTIGFADCPTIFLYDPITGVIGLIHAGWKSLAANIIKNTINRMRIEFNSNPADVKVLIGPGICVNCYEVGPEVAIKFGWKVESKVHFNLNEEIKRQLTNEEIRPFNIIESGECTKHTDNGEKYYSWRRDRSDPLNTNMAVLIMR